MNYCTVFVLPLIYIAQQYIDIYNLRKHLYVGECIRHFIDSWYEKKLGDDIFLLESKPSLKTIYKRKLIFTIYFVHRFVQHVQKVQKRYKIVLKELYCITVWFFKALESVLSVWAVMVLTIFGCLFMEKIKYKVSAWFCENT